MFLCSLYLTITIYFGKFVVSVRRTVIPLIGGPKRPNLSDTNRFTTAAPAHEC